MDMLRVAGGRLWGERGALIAESEAGMEPLGPGEPWDAGYAVNQRYKPQPMEGPSGGASGPEDVPANQPMAATCPNRQASGFR